MLQNIRLMSFAAKMRMKELLSDERGEVNIVAIVVLIGIAVLLAIVFKDEIGGLIRDLLQTIRGNATSVVNDPVGGGN